MPRRLFHYLTLFFIFAAALAAPSCSKQQAGSGDQDITGAYHLVSVDGSEVPASVSHSGATLKVISGVFTINADGTCNSKTVLVPPAGSEVSREVTAQYTRDGSRLTMKWKNAGMTIGSVAGDTFTMDNEGMVFVYRK